MKTENDMYDVRFFGEPHERAMVPPNQIRPITTSLSAMQVMCDSSHFISPYLISPHLTLPHLTSPNHFISPYLISPYPITSSHLTQSLHLTSAHPCSSPSPPPPIPTPPINRHFTAGYAADTDRVHTSPVLCRNGMDL